MNLLGDADLTKKGAENRIDGLWLIYTLRDGNVIEYKTKEGTHNFSLVREKEKFVISLDLL